MQMERGQRWRAELWGWWRNWSETDQKETFVLVLDLNWVSVCDLVCSPPEPYMWNSLIPEPALQDRGCCSCTAPPGNRHIQHRQQQSTLVPASTQPTQKHGRLRHDSEPGWVRRDHKGINNRGLQGPEWARRVRSLKWLINLWEAHNLHQPKSSRGLWSHVRAIIRRDTEGKNRDFSFSGQFWDFGPVFYMCSFNLL